MDPVFRFEQKFLERWKREGVDPRVAGHAFRSLYEAYTHPERGYHDFQHILDLDREFDCWKDVAEDPDAVWDSMCWHDAWMIARAGVIDNEEKSFLMMRADTKDFNMPVTYYAKCEHIVVRGTKHRGGLIYRDEQLMADMDLAGFGHPWPVVLAASRRVRYEYRRVPQENYIAGRTNILQMFLDRGKNLYYLPVFQHEYGERAIANLTCEIEQMSKLVKRFDNGE